MALSCDRLAMDHFVSGALIGAITSFSVNKNNNNTKKTVKFALNGAISTSCAIMASNKIAQKKYLDAICWASIGVVGVVLNDKILKD